MSSWYRRSRPEFTEEGPDRVVSALHEAAARDGWVIDPDQDTEWRASIDLLRAALALPSCAFIEGVLLEYDFRRRGIRIDCILVAKGLLLVLEFKRSAVTAADRDQVMNYCVNLIEFHELTQTALPTLVPVLVSRKSTSLEAPSARRHPLWPQLLDEPITLGGQHLAAGLGSLTALAASTRLSWEAWDVSAFAPSSTIVDAALSLYGNHDVSAMRSHRAEKEDIDACLVSVLEEIERATAAGGRELILVSGAPGAGKTLVGLSIVFQERFGREAIFVTGNAPLVDVLNGALERSYRGARRLAGFVREGASLLERNVDFKIAKAHRFLGPTKTPQKERVLVFDEAQRTYSAGTIVNRQAPLERDEAELIIERMEAMDRPLIVLLLGQNQHINARELGPATWLRAAAKRGWKFAASDETLALPDLLDSNSPWTCHPLRSRIARTHLTSSIRDQRTNGDLERWVHHVMANQPDEAARLARLLPKSSQVQLTRSLETARQWARAQRLGDERAGLIASGQGRRLRPEGVFPDEKPDIVDWMLSPSGDVRSSNMLEQTQNQYQIQGLELDYAIVCWDADLRREGGTWASYNVSGPSWRAASGELEARTNSYRVLLTRSRKGLVVFVPRGDPTGSDPTRTPQVYDDIVDYLRSCGVLLL